LIPGIGVDLHDALGGVDLVQVGGVGIADAIMV
jgi:hypothetical protein